MCARATHTLKHARLFIVIKKKKEKGKKERKKEKMRYNA